MQNSGCAVEFAPAEGFAFGSRDINNLSVRKAIGPDLTVIDSIGCQVACKSGADTSCRESVDDQSKRKRVNPKTMHLCLDAIGQQFGFKIFLLRTQQY